MTPQTTTPLPVILASKSAIRKQILTQAGVDFTVQTKPVDEGEIKRAMLAEGAPLKDIVDGLAQAKSIRVSRQCGGLVIGADQIMVMDGVLFDKPETVAAARERLWSMRGKTHELIGAMVICQDGQAVWRHMSVVKLQVRAFSQSFLDSYMAAEGALVTQSVGGYRFEARGAQLFESVSFEQGGGDMFSILGLSLLPLLDYLRLRGAIES